LIAILIFITKNLKSIAFYFLENLRDVKMCNMNVLTAIEHLTFPVSQEFAISGQTAGNKSFANFKTHRTLLKLLNSSQLRARFSHKQAIKRKSVNCKRL